MLQHWGNKKPFGEGQLYPENQWNAHKPNSEKYSAKQKDTAWQEWASFVNSATGGDQFKKGIVSIPPAVWKNYVKTYLGGPMSFIEGIYDATAEEDITKAPFIRKAYGEVGLNADAGKFYQTTEKPIEAAKAYKDAAKSDPKYAKEMMQSEKVMIQLGELAMNYKEQLGKFTKDDIRIKDNVDYTDAEKRLKLKINEKRRSDYQEEYLAKQRQKLGDASVR
jgi:predicted DNA-binding WGR domain protein